jgi:hypothetical protein
MFLAVTDVEFRTQHWPEDDCCNVKRSTPRLVAAVRIVPPPWGPKEGQPPLTGGSPEGFSPSLPAQSSSRCLELLSMKSFCLQPRSMLHWA